MRPLLLAAAFALAGCASSPGGLPDTPTLQRSVTDIETGEGATYTVTQTLERNIREAGLSAAPQAAWALLPDLFAEMGIPVTVVDRANLLLGTQERRLSRIASQRPSRYLECGSGMAGQYANIYHVYVTLVTQILPAADGSTVRTQLEASARDPGHGNNPVRCTSKGVLEGEIVRALQERLQGPGE